jgi:xanthine dehydrogenase YagR molybdenum-binding subunit
MKNEEVARYYTEGIDVPETADPAFDQEPWPSTRVVGQPVPKVDGYERVSGTAVYPADIVLPGMLHGALLRCPHAHAMVTAVDVSEAEGMPGVRGVLSAFTPDDPATRAHSEYIRTQLFDSHCRFEGEAVAAVVADTPYQARDALRAIRVEYDVRPHLSDERQALEPNAHQVHDDGNQSGSPQQYERGDVEAGFAEADVVLEEEYRTETQMHAPMEPHGCVASWDGDSLTVWESTQGVYNIQPAVAAALGMPLSRVRVVGHYMGGGFGSKLQAGKYTILAALFAKKTARPVKITLSREETFLATGNRPPANMRIKAGIKRDGTLTALEYVATATGGAYGNGGPSALAWLTQNCYTCPNVRTELQGFYTNAGPSRPMRGPGHPQNTWSLEQMLDALAAAIDMDPIDLRLKNIPTVSQTIAGNPPYTSTGFAECLTEGASTFQWREKREEIRAAGTDSHIRRGVGVSGGSWAAGGGGPPSTSIITLYSDGSVVLNMGASDIGCGTKTVMAMIVAEELGVDPNDVRIEHADTGTTQFASASGGSKTIPTESPAVRAAALEVKRQLFEIAAEEMEVDASTLSLQDGAIVSSESPSEPREFSSITGLRRRRTLTGIGYRGPNPADKAINPWCAQFCEVEVNMKTGAIKILRFLAAHDSGRVMNALTYRNQVFGGIAMGIALGKTERRVLDGVQTGKMLNRNSLDYGVPTVLDVADEFECVPIDPGDTEANTVGCKGIGEPATIPTAAAFANAVYDATGVRVTGAPINRVNLLNALAASEQGD